MRIAGEVARFFAFSLMEAAWVLAGPAPDTAINYQGQLKQDSAPANGDFDLRFQLFNDSGTVVVGPICFDNLAVVNGLFAVELDFGSGVFDGEAREIEVGVRDGGAAGNCNTGNYFIFAPRQRLAPAPYALHALGVPSPLEVANLTPGAPVVHAQNDGHGDDTIALRGIATGSSGMTIGVRGETYGNSGRAVYGSAMNTGGTNYGGYFESSSTIGIGVLGVGQNISGTNIAVRGHTNSPEGYSGYFTGGFGYFSGNLGIGDSTPGATLTVGNGDKVQISGSEGDVTFTDDRATITFPSADSVNAPMIHMYTLGTDNANRMVLSHSPAFPNWGLQYQDSEGNEFHFLRAGTSVMTVDLENSAVGVGTANPAAKLNIRGGAGDNVLLIEDSAGNDIVTVPDDLGQIRFGAGARFFGGVRLSSLPPDGIYQVCLTEDFFLTFCSGSSQPAIASDAPAGLSPVHSPEAEALREEIAALRDLYESQSEQWQSAVAKVSEAKDEQLTRQAAEIADLKDRLAALEQRIAPPDGQSE